MNYFQTTSVPTDIKEFIEGMLHALAQPVMQRSVKELLWGYQDEVLTEIQKFSPAMVPTTIVSIFNQSVILYTCCRH